MALARYVARLWYTRFVPTTKHLIKNIIENDPQTYKLGQSLTEIILDTTFYDCRGFNG